jgi:hypothetical protein
MLARILRDTGALGFDARRLETAADKAGMRRLYSTLEHPVAGNQCSDEDIVRWLHRGIAAGRLMALDISFQEPALDPSRARLQPSLPMVSGGVPSLTITTFPGRPQLLGSLRERCVEVLLRAAQEMDDDLSSEYYDVLVPSALADAASEMVRWTERFAVAQTGPFDGWMFALTYSLSGWSAFEGLKELAECVRCCWNYNSDAALDQAAEHLAGAVSWLGPMTFIQLTSGGDTDTEPVDDFEAAMERWTGYIETLRIDATDAERGAVWGALGVRKHALAAAMAQRRGRATLVSALGHTDFAARYLAEFGPRLTTRLTRQVWDAVSFHYLRQLRGRVTYYTDESSMPDADARGRDGLARLLAQLPPTVIEVEVVGLDGIGEPSVLTGPFAPR